MVEIGARVQFAGEFRNGVSSQRMGRVVLGVGAAGAAVENVVGGKMHQARVHLPARHGQVAHGERVHQERRLRLFFRDVHLVIRRGIDDDGRVELRERALHLRLIGDVDGGALEAGDFESARLEFGHQLDSELSAAAENGHAFALHAPIMSYSCRSAAIGSMFIARRAGT